MTKNTNGDEHVADPTRRWSFDDPRVVDSFDRMLDASIPGIADMRTLTTRMCTHALDTFDGREHLRVVDLGASRGDAVAPLLNRDDVHRVTLCEISPPMIEALEQRFGHRGDVEISCVDLAEHPQFLTYARAHLVLSVLTLMFVPVENRQALVQCVVEGLEPGGHVVIVEKTLGDSPYGQRTLVDTYHAFKIENGYSQENVERKRMSLKGSLVPMKPAWTEELMRDAGLVDVQRFWQSLQFVGWIARKP